MLRLQVRNGGASFLLKQNVYRNFDFKRAAALVDRALNELVPAIHVFGLYSDLSTWCPRHSAGIDDARRRRFLLPLQYTRI